MKNDFTVQELATVWNVSVNTVWKRLNKLKKELKNDDNRLLMVKKRVNNREITVITISKDLLNEFLVNNPVNNGDYEELLTDNNDYNPVNNPENSINTREVIDKIMNYSEQVNITVNNIHNEYNKRLLTIQEELLKEKAKVPLLEDKAAREGMYINEINELKKAKKHQQRLFAVVSLTLFILLVISVGTIIFLSLNAKQQAEIKPPAVIETENKTIH